MVTPLPLAAALKRDVPGIKYVAATDWLKLHALTVDDKKIYVSGTMAGSDFLQLFQYPLTSGSRNELLKDPLFNSAERVNGQSIMIVTHVVFIAQ